MSLTFNEIRLAALAGKTFTLTGVRIRELGIDENGIKIEYLMPNASNYQPDAPLDFISINKPKHDPCRLFRKGDKVRVVECKGRRAGYGKNIFKVSEDEEKSGRNIILTQDDFIEHNIVDAAYLELITPVEELEPYKLIDSPNTYNIVRDSAMVMTIHKKSHPNAKAAAEAERDRLNAEYRKEYKNEN